MKKIYLTMLMAAASAIAADAQLYFVGNFNDFDLGNPVKVDADAEGNYVFQQSGLQKFKMSTVNSTSWDGEGGFNSGAYGINTNTTRMTAPGTYNIEPWAEDQLLPWYGDWTVTVNGDLTKMTIATTTPEPQGETFYLRGSMNGWGSSAEWQFELVEGKEYVLRNVTIPAGAKFKVADAAWGSINYGGKTNMNPEEEYMLIYNGTDCSMGGDGSYFGNIHFNLSTAKISFSAGSEPPVDTTLYIGYEGDTPETFDADTALRFEQDYTQYFLVLPEGISGNWFVWNGTERYKFAPKSDEKVDCSGTFDLWFGGEGYISFNTTNELTVKVTIPEDSYGDGVTVPATLTLEEKLSGLTSIETEDRAPVYYNLQGMRVINPDKGMYIVRQGEKVSKTLVK